ncbi:MAG: AAA domain-containing protein [Hyphomicrobiaceae bacterium]
MLDNTTYDWDASFDDLLRRFRRADSLGSEDIVRAVRSLFEECLELHEAGRVAALDRVDLLHVSPDGEISLGRVPIGSNEIAEIELAPENDAPPPERAPDEGDDAQRGQGLIGKPDGIPQRPLYYPGYASWEQILGHHDALTDIFHLGMLMASLATQLDFRDVGDLTQFVKHRDNLVRLNPGLHPVLARVIADMTKLRRTERAADLSALIDLIDDYRSVEVDDAEAKASELADVADLSLRRERTQEYFRNRLFEVTRRNKLLYFADRHGVDLTRGSLPLMLDYTTLRPRQLLTTTSDLLQRLASLNELGEAKGELDLRRWLQCADYPFLAPSLDKVRSAARKDSRELGFNQLRLVLAFLRWHDDERAERINTPLVMLPVSLKKQAGTTDSFSLVLETPITEAEINPVLRYILNDRFQVDLPETLDMSDLSAILGLGERLESDVGKSRPGLAVRVADTPHVPLLQAALRRQIEEHRRRQRRSTVRLKDWRGIGYSYSADSYQPLGLELFDRFVRQHPVFERGAADSLAPDVESGMPAPADVLSPITNHFAKEITEQADPRIWEIDLCAVTLANFNTRKMSLVRDYEILLDRYGGAHANYKRLFELGVCPELRAIDKTPHTERNTVLPSDPSQDDAVLRAATGESYVIQGPPGAGKSQTIANLLADLAANGKSVLFVCEKRVALDVVHQRLRDAGIGELASLVHDARDDRLGFIANLKTLYEGWLASRASRTIRDKRAAVVADIETLATQLRTFSSAMQRFVGAGDTTLRDLLGIAIERAIARPRISLREREAVPPWGVFVEGEAPLATLEQILQGVPVERVRALEVLSALPKSFFDLPDPIADLRSILPSVHLAVADLEATASAAIRGVDEPEPSLSTLLAQTRLASQLQPLAAIGRLDLLDSEAPETLLLREQLQTLDALDIELAQAAAVNGVWHRKPTPAEVEAWTKIARRYDGRPWAFLSAEWRAVKQKLSEDLGERHGNPVAALASLAHEQKIIAARDDHARLVRQSLSIEDLDALRASLTRVWERAHALPPAERALFNAVLGGKNEMRPRVLTLAAKNSALEKARDTIIRLFPSFDQATPSTIADRLEALEVIKDHLVDLAAAMRDLDYAAPALGQTWRREPIALDTLRAASLHMEIQRFFAQHTAAQRVTARDLQRVAEDLASKLTELRTLNARRILDERKSRFRGRIASPSDDYDVGRAFLEHQFSLHRPSAALRDFLTGSPGVVVRDLKPIWMMSPLSVADTLPLDEGLFDVVVFDEASQIPIEDALPTLYRAPQMIVVGDEMQLPPPSYFGRKLDTDENDLPDYIAFGMQAESLLDKAAAALPATRLEWHYRSRHESLIGFCNQAFYSGQLRTIPSRHPLSTSTPIDTSTSMPMKDQAQRVLNRPISFHRLPDASYVAQRNTKEATYIADLVRALLSQDASKTIGIVAFSQAQQAAIEDALERLAAEHPSFRNRLERAIGLDHEELFVKNLENVQGDERDIIIVSIAYGPGATGRMIMNFGPINQEGGEKRLNVIFSRAKHHVAVVTSIDPAQITNDWNKGAKALKRYLMYASAVSTGNADGMREALAGYPGAENILRATQVADPLADFICETYRDQGKATVRGLGQSTARCDVAVRALGADAFTTAILTDNASHYAIADVVDRYVTYPGLLRAAGWKVELALAKDWLARIPRPDDTSVDERGVMRDPSRIARGQERKVDRNA